MSSEKYSYFIITSAYFSSVRIKKSKMHNHIHMNKDVDKMNGIYEKLKSKQEKLAVIGLRIRRNAFGSGLF